MIENRLRTGKIKMAYIIMFGVIFSLSAYSLFERDLPYKEIIILGFLSLVILAYLSMLLLKLNYFSLDTTKDKISVRFYTAHPVFRKFKLIDIPQKSLSNYYIKKTIFGLKQEIILEAKTPKGEFKFPPVSISALPTKKKENMILLLDEILKKN